MSKAEKFIIDSTKNYSNEKRITIGKLSHWEKQPWLTPDDARKAVEIAREEMVEKACDAYCRLCDTKECGNAGECIWVEKFRKRLMK